MKLKEIGEFGLIERLNGPAGPVRPEIVVGVGDDASVIDIGDGRLLLASCDVQVEGVHFRSAWSSPEEIGRRAAAVNLSDIAAMGGDPAFALVSLMLPSQLDVETIDGIYLGMRAEFDRWQVQIIGGNTAKSNGGLAIDVTILGYTARDRLLRRDGASPGEVLCVTGDLGRAGAGLDLCKSKLDSIDETVRRDALRAYLTPTPRVAEGQMLSRFGGVTACMDLSDGLASDAGHLAKQSGVRLKIDLDGLPISKETVEICKLTQKDPWKMALNGGEDFELLFSAPPAVAGAVANGLKRNLKTKVSVIGEVEQGNGEVEFEREGTRVSIDEKGFDHFGK